MTQAAGAPDEGSPPAPCGPMCPTTLSVPCAARTRASSLRPEPLPHLQLSLFQQTAMPQALQSAWGIVSSFPRPHRRTKSICCTPQGCSRVLRDLQRRGLSAARNGCQVPGMPDLLPNGGLLEHAVDGNGDPAEQKQPVAGQGRSQPPVPLPLHRQHKGRQERGPRAAMARLPAAPAAHSRGENRPAPFGPPPGAETARLTSAAIW